MKRFIIILASLWLLLTTANAQSIVATETVVEPPIFLRAATSWTFKAPDRCWDDYSWLNPRDWWPYRDFHVAFSWPAGKSEVQIKFLTRRAWNTYQKAKIDGGVPRPVRSGNTVRWEITAGYRARNAGPYSWLDNAYAWGREVRICYR